jgi:hypothetical protein
LNAAAVVGLGLPPEAQRRSRRLRPRAITRLGCSSGRLGSHSATRQPATGLNGRPGIVCEQIRGAFIRGAATEPRVGPAATRQQWPCIRKGAFSGASNAQGLGGRTRSGYGTGTRLGPGCVSRAWSHRGRSGGRRYVGGWYQAGRRQSTGDTVVGFHDGRSPGWHCRLPALGASWPCDGSHGPARCRARSR